MRQVKKQHADGYGVPPDVCRQFRDDLPNLHSSGDLKSTLDVIAETQTEASRRKCRGLAGWHRSSLFAQSGDRT